MIRTLLLYVFLVFTSHLSAQQTVGLFQNAPESYNGYTLFSNNEITYLIDNCGMVVHTWESAFRPGNSLYLLENGNLLRTARITGAFSGGGIGGRIELFNWEGDLLWEYEHASFDYHHHHDIEPLPNGNFLLVAWERMSPAAAIDNGRNPDTVTPDGIWPEQIIEIEMQGTNQAAWVWEWHLKDHLIQDFDDTKASFGVVADHPELVNFNFPPGDNNADWNHVNAISYHEGLDQIAISAHRFSEIWIIDHSTTTEEAAGHTGGTSGMGGDLLYRWGNPLAYDRGTADSQTLFSQHDIRWLPQGHPFEDQLMVFNNRKFNNQSAIDIWPPPLNSDNTYTITNDQPFGPEDLSWTYTDDDFYSVRISGAHALPNDNILICEGNKGKFTEVTLTGEMVWSYINPVNQNTGPIAQGNPSGSNNTFRVSRYAPDYPAFSGRELTPVAPIELNPFPSDCMISVATDIDNTFSPMGLVLKNTLVDEVLYIINEDQQFFEVEVFDLMGKVVARVSGEEAEFMLSLEHLQSGIYGVRGRRGLDNGFMGIGKVFRRMGF